MKGFVVHWRNSPSVCDLILQDRFEKKYWEEATSEYFGAVLESDRFQVE